MKQIGPAVIPPILQLVEPTAERAQLLANQGLSDEDMTAIRVQGVILLVELANLAEPGVPALVRILEAYDLDLVFPILFALQEIGPAAKAAIPAILRLLPKIRAELKDLPDGGSGELDPGALVFNALWSIFPEGAKAAEQAFLDTFNKPRSAPVAEVPVAEARKPDKLNPHSQVIPPSPVPTKTPSPTVPSPTTESDNVGVDGAARFLTALDPTVRQRLLKGEEEIAKVLEGLANQTLKFVLARREGKTIIRVVPVKKEGILDTSLQEEGPPPSSHESLAAIDAKYLALREETRHAIEQALAEKAGKEFASLEARQAFAAQVRELLQRFDLRLECPNPDCHQPATLTARLAGNSKQGVFQFVHGSLPSHGGSGTLPPGLKVIDAPPDRRVKHKPPLEPSLPHSA